MAYTPPAGSAIVFAFAGATYTPPAGNAVTFQFSPVVPLLVPGHRTLLAQRALFETAWHPLPRRGLALAPAPSPPIGGRPVLFVIT